MQIDRSFVQRWERFKGSVVYTTGGNVSVHAYSGIDRCTRKIVEQAVHINELMD